MLTNLTACVRNIIMASRLEHRAIENILRYTDREGVSNVRWPWCADMQLS